MNDRDRAEAVLRGLVISFSPMERGYTPALDRIGANVDALVRFASEARREERGHIIAFLRGRQPGVLCGALAFLVDTEAHLARAPERDNCPRCASTDTHLVGPDTYVCKDCRARAESDAAQYGHEADDEDSTFRPAPPPPAPGPRFSDSPKCESNGYNEPAPGPDARALANRLGAKWYRQFPEGDDPRLFELRADLILLVQMVTQPASGPEPGSAFVMVDVTSDPLGFESGPGPDARGVCRVCGGSGVVSSPYELDAEDCPSCTRSES